MAQLAPGRVPGRRRRQSTGRRRSVRGGGGRSRCSGHVHAGSDDHRGRAALIWFWSRREHDERCAAPRTRALHAIVGVTSWIRSSQRATWRSHASLRGAMVAPMREVVGSSEGSALGHPASADLAPFGIGGAAPQPGQRVVRQGEVQAFPADGACRTELLGPAVVGSRSPHEFRRALPAAPQPADATATAPFPPPVSLPNAMVTARFRAEVGPTGPKRHNAGTTTGDPERDTGAAGWLRPSSSRPTAAGYWVATAAGKVWTYGS